MPSSTSPSPPSPIYFEYIDADIREILPLILGDILHTPYFIHPSVSGMLTVRTTSSVSQSQALNILQTALEAQGITFVDHDGLILVLPIDMSSSPRTVLAEIHSTPASQPPDIIPLDHVPATQIVAFLHTLGVPPSNVLAAPPGTRIIVRGSPTERSTIRSLILALDVPWLADRHLQIAPLRYASSVSVARELTDLFVSPVISDAFSMRFSPIERINAVAIIGASTDELVRVRQALDYLDWIDPASRSATFSYRPRHILPSQLSALLQQALSDHAVPLADRTTPSVNFPASSRSFSIAESGVFPLPLSDGQPPLIEYLSVVDPNRRTTVLHDDEHESLMVIGRAADIDLARKITERFDVARAQVLVEATIVEVLLNDALRYGLEWSFNTGRLSGALGLTDRAQSRSLDGGLSLLFSAPSATIVLEALSKVTDVQVLSAPHLVVMSGEEASLIVGDQVPVPISTIIDDREGGTRVITTNEFRDTGITFSIRPRVDRSGTVTLDIRQSISASVSNSLGVGVAPAFHQRIVETRVSVADAVTVALGGLIREQRTKGETGVPVLASIPLVGGLFRKSEESVSRTELLVLIRPRIIDSDLEYVNILKEMLEKFTNIAESWG